MLHYAQNALPLYFQMCVSGVIPISSECLTKRDFYLNAAKNKGETKTLNI